MKYVIKNSALVFVLTSLFAIPFMGFGFMKYDPSNNVLGVSNDIFIQTQKTTEDGMSANRGISESKVVEQIDLVLTLSGDSYQKFYDVIPEELIDAAYSYIIVFSNEYKEDGMVAKIEVNDLKADLVVNVPDNFTVQSVPVSILILR